MQKCQVKSKKSQISTEQKRKEKNQSASKHKPQIWLQIAKCSQIRTLKRGPSWKRISAFHDEFCRIECPLSRTASAQHSFLQPRIRVPSGPCSICGVHPQFSWRGAASKEKTNALNFSEKFHNHSSSYCRHNLEEAKAASSCWQKCKKIRMQIC